MIEGKFNTDQFMMGSVMTYQKAIRLMQESWMSVFNEHLELTARQPLAQFEEALDRFTQTLARHNPDSAKLHNALRDISAADPVVEDLFNDTLDATPQERSSALSRDMDMVPPRVCIVAIFETAREHLTEAGVVTVPLRDFMRPMMAKIARHMRWSSPLRVGENRHFPRAWQWISEASEASWLYEGYGIRPMNTRGPVPRYPVGPGDLRVRLDATRL